MVFIPAHVWVPLSMTRHDSPSQPHQVAQAGRLQASLQLLGEEDVRQLALPIASPVTSPGREVNGERQETMGKKMGKCMEHMVEIWLKYMGKMENVVKRPLSTAVNEAWVGKTIEVYRTQLAVFHQAMFDNPGDGLGLPGSCLSSWSRTRT